MFGPWKQAQQRLAALTASLTRAETIVNRMLGVQQEAEHYAQHVHNLLTMAAGEVDALEGLHDRASSRMQELEAVTHGFEPLVAGLARTTTDLHETLGQAEKFRMQVLGLYADIEGALQAMDMVVRRSEAIRHLVHQRLEPLERAPVVFGKDRRQRLESESSS